MTAPVPAATDEQPLDAQDTPAPEPAAAPLPALPDRADAPVSEVVERFLRAVVAEVPLELIEELHLFSPLRQGTVETGIAVLAARVPVADLQEQGAEPELPFEAKVEVVADAAAEAEAGAEVAGDAQPDADADADVEAEADVDADADAPMGDEAIVVSEDGRIVLSASLMGDDEMLDDDMLDDETLDAEMLDDEDGDDVEAKADAMEADAAAGDDVDVIAAEGDDDEDVSVSDDLVVEASADESDEADAVSEPVEVVKTRPVRHTVYTARYRYVIKGPERGKWESNVKAEADAPLITVETVVRGVQRRAGEESEIVRYTGAQIAKALRVPYPA